MTVVIGRSARRDSRRAAVVAAIGADDEQAALDLLELIDLAWHDCYGEVAPPPDVFDDILLVGRGSLTALITACRLAVTDRRDLRMAASAL